MLSTLQEKPRVEKATNYIYVIIVLERVTLKTLVKTLNSQVIEICLPFQ